MWDDDIEKKDILNLLYIMELNWFSLEQLLVFLYFYKHLYNTFKWEKRKKEIHLLSWISANSSYHIINVCFLINFLRLEINDLKSKWEILSRKFQNYSDLFENFKFIILIVALFHDLVEEYRWIVKNDWEFSFLNTKELYTKVNKHIILNTTNIPKLVVFLDNIKQKFLSYEKYHFLFPFLKKYFWSNYKDQLILSNPKLLFEEIWLFNLFCFLMDFKNWIIHWDDDISYILKTWNFCLEDDQIINIIIWVWLLTFNNEKSDFHKDYATNIVEHNFIWIIKLCDLIDNIKKWIWDSQREKYKKSYKLFLLSIYEFYSILPEFVKNWMDDDMREFVLNTIKNLLVKTLISN